MKTIANHIKNLLSILLFLYLLDSTEGAFNRCFKCRSRGELGTCKAPFRYNASALEGVQGVEAIACPSGWCGKIVDRGSNSFKEEEYGAATERLCLQRGPDDNEERCAPTTWRHEKVYMCFCQGDLCNKGMTHHPTIILFVLTSVLTVLKLIP